MREEAKLLVAELKEIAETRRHILLLGKPGSGKTMLARRICALRGPLDAIEAREVARIYTGCGLLDPESGENPHRPLRAPHCTVSPIGLIGSISRQEDRPANAHPAWPVLYGEMSLAHHGVLFLDEIEEFSRPCHLVVCQAIRDEYFPGLIPRVHQLGALSHVSGMHYAFPTEFQLVATCNDLPSFKRRVTPLLRKQFMTLAVPSATSKELAAGEGIVQQACLAIDEEVDACRK